MSKNKGFTLIELLAVIVILGVIMFVAIPMVTSYIENAKKDAFIDNAKMAIRQARNDLLGQNAGNCDFKQNGCITLSTADMDFEKAFQSPYGGSMVASYVKICGNATGTKYTYYYGGVDDKNNGINHFVEEKDLKRDDVVKGEAGSTVSEVENLCQY